MMVLSDSEDVGMRGGATYPNDYISEDALSQTDYYGKRAVYQQN